VTVSVDADGFLGAYDGVRKYLGYGEAVPVPQDELVGQTVAEGHDVVYYLTGAGTVLSARRGGAGWTRDVRNNEECAADMHLDRVAERRGAF
jgi:hypothetical protein